MDIFSSNKPASRATDPDTSKRAETVHGILGKRAERQRQVLQLIVDSPGATTGELARYMHSKFPDLPIAVAVESPHKRVSDLEDKGLVRRGPERRCRDSGYDRLTWWATPIGIDEAYGLTPTRGN